MMLWYGHDMSWWGYAGMGIGMVLFWALIIVGIVALIRFSSGAATTSGPSAPLHTPPQTMSPQHVLADRFARGEISESEYRDRLAVLADHAHSDATGQADARPGGA